MSSLADSGTRLPPALRQEPDSDPLAATIAQWVDTGLIDSAGGERILAYERGLPADAPPAVAARVATLPAAATRRARGIDFGSIVMYFGAFLVLFALTIFIGAGWEDMGRGAQFFWALVAVAGLGGLGVWVRRSLGGITGGNLLIFAATGAVPLLSYTFQRLIGWWPERSELLYEDFYDRIRPEWVAMEVVSLVAAVLVAFRIRFPLVMLLAAFWSWFLSMDLVRWIAGDEMFSWSQAMQWQSAAIGLVMAGVAAWLYYRDLSGYGMWLALFGNIIWIGHMASLALGDEVALAKALFPLLGVGAVVASAWLQARVFLVFGAIALYAWVSYLVFQVFGTGLGVTVGLVVIGLIMLFSGMYYQRVMGPWLQEWFGHHHTTGASTPGAHL